MTDCDKVAAGLFGLEIRAKLECGDDRYVAELARYAFHFATKTVLIEEVA